MTNRCLPGVVILAFGGLRPHSVILALDINFLSHAGKRSVGCGPIRRGAGYRVMAGRIRTGPV